MSTHEVWSNGELISSRELPDEPIEDYLAAAVAAIRTNAANLSPTGPTRKALEAIADALEAMPS